jgi:uncharacterized membrane protein YqiK
MDLISIKNFYLSLFNYIKPDIHLLEFIINGLLGIIGVTILVFAALFFMSYTVAEPNEAVLVSGIGANSGEQGLGFKIVTGKGTFVIPFFQRVRRFNLDQRVARLEKLSCLSSQRIPVNLNAVASFKVGDSKPEIANAARRFLDKQSEMEPNVQEILAGHLRSIIGALTVEELIHDREKLITKIREASSSDMEKFGLIIDSLQIQNVHDEVNYINNLSKIQAAQVERDARVAEAEANRAATEAEQVAEARNAEAMRNTALKRAEYQAEIDKANAEAAQSGPLAETKARQAVVVEETEIAKLEAQREEQRLDSEIRKQADAKAYEQVTLAEAERATEVKRAEAEAEAMRLDAEARANAVKLAAEADAAKVKMLGDSEASATTAKGQAEGEAIRAKTTAEAEGIAKRADALAKESKAVIEQQLAEKMPEIVRAAAEPLSRVQGMTILNGGDGLMDVLSTTILRAMETANAVKGMVSDEEVKPSVNGSRPAKRVQAAPRSRKE